VSAAAAVPAAGAGATSQLTASLRLRELPRRSQRIVVKLWSRKTGRARYIARLTIKRSGKVRLQYLRQSRSGKVRTLGRSRTLLPRITQGVPYTIDYRTTGRKRVTLSTRMWQSSDTAGARWMTRRDRSRTRLRSAGRDGMSVRASRGVQKPILAATPGTGSGVRAPGPTPAPAGSWWVPAKGTSWQWQLTGTLDTSVDAAVFDIDGEDNSAKTVAALHAAGRKVICYLSAGSWEDWRTDADAFPASVTGKTLDGWPDEKWLDIRALDILLPIMDARIAACAAKGFDAVEPDNVDGYTNNTGFPLTAADQATYNKAIAELAHSHGLGVALKNNPDQAAELEPHFDFAIVEECARYNECNKYTPFTKAGKAVLHVEYTGTLDSFCPTTTALGFSSMRKELDLTAWRNPCP
jgi:hypothetical protein